MRAEAEAARGRKRGLRRGWGEGGIMGAIGGEKVGGTEGGAGEGSEGARQGLDPLRHFRDRGGMGGPTKRGISQGGNPTGLEVGADRVEVALTRGQTMEGSHPDDLA